jgi:hypothetical protein
MPTTPPPIPLFKIIDQNSVSIQLRFVLEFVDNKLTTMMNSKPHLKVN